MYTINQVQSEGLQYLEMLSPDNISSAKICLNRGASVEALVIKSESLIVDLHPLEYKSTYASSILFPFANRIKDGKYNYNGQEFQFECNEANLNNALHGLVHHKTFEVTSSSASENGATVTMAYVETEKEKGFPYKYTILVTYTLTNTSLDVKVEVQNNDENTFPFTIGWHPYFLSSDLYNSTLSFESPATVSFDERMITSEVVANENPTTLIEIKDQQLDNCYALESGKGTVEFNTPKYNLKIISSSEANYFQMYTPPKKNTIALEPVTGISDSFNNKLGLQELSSDETYEITWQLIVE